MQEVNLPIRQPDYPDVKPFLYSTSDGDQEVTLTSWVWRVEYTDEKGGVLDQYDFDSWTFNQFKQIDVTRPFVFRMINADALLGRAELVNYSLLFNPVTMKLIHFYRNGMLDNLTQFPRLHVFGYEQNIAGKTFKTFFVITPDGQLVITDDMERIHF